MNIHEYQGKELLAKFGIAIPKGIPAMTVAEAVEAANSAQKQVLSRKLLPIPNVYVQRMYRDFEGLDGELIVGRPTDKGVFQATTSGVMSINGEPDIKFYVFDDVTYPEHTYEVRRARLTARFGGFQGAEDDLVCVPQVLIHNERQLLAEEKRILELGYEGVMIRDPLGRYKFGRSTAREGALLKLKRFEDAEAEIILVLPELHNTNVATRDELGRTKRSKEMAGLVPKNIAGVFHVRGVNGIGWVFVLIALLADLGLIGSSARQRRERARST